MYASINKDMNKYSAWFLKIIFNAYSRNKYLGDDKGFNNYNKLLKGKINWKNPQ